MTAEGAVQRSYSDQEKGAALLALDLNNGYVKSSAHQLDVPRGTLQHWDKASEEVKARARAALSEHSKVQTLADTFLRLAQAGADHALATLERASPYHGALIGAIALDKWALITGRPTSRTEVLKARYVEPASLRLTAAAVIDVPALTSGSTQVVVSRRNKRRTRRQPVVEGTDRKVGEG